MSEQEAWEAAGIEGFGMTMIPRREVWRLAWKAAQGEAAVLDSDAIKMFPTKPVASGTFSHATLDKIDSLEADGE